MGKTIAKVPPAQRRRTEPPHHPVQYAAGGDEPVADFNRLYTIRQAAEATGITTGSSSGR